MTTLTLGAVLFGLVFLAAGAQEPSPDFNTMISGGDLPHSVRLTAVDEDAFVRRLDVPPIFTESQGLAGPVYSVTSPYWGDVLRAAGVDTAPNKLEASYYLESGYVQTDVEGEEFWLVLNQRQRAILDRYIGLTVADLLVDEPGLMEILVAASRIESITVQVGSRFLSEAETARFWQVSAGLPRLASQALQEEPKPEDGEGSLWIIFNLPEGRAVQMRYFVAAAALVDSLGSDAYRVPDNWLGDVLGADAPTAGEPLKVGGRVVGQEAGHGSIVWWFVMVGGGLSAIGIALWLRRAGQVKPT